jgi:hypothetical protein
MFGIIPGNGYKIKALARVGPVAQRLEQRTHNTEDRSAWF